MLNQTVIVLMPTLVIAISAIDAAPGSGRENGNTGDNGNSAFISYHIDEHCAITISSTKDISDIVIKDDHGRTLTKWDNLSNKFFGSDELDIYASVLTVGTLHVKSDDNGKHGLGPDIGQTFRDELTNCLEPQFDCPCLQAGEAWAEYLTLPRVPRLDPNFIFPGEIDYPGVHPELSEYELDILLANPSSTPYELESRRDGFIFIQQVAPYSCGAATSATQQWQSTPSTRITMADVQTCAAEITELLSQMGIDGRTSGLPE